MTTEFEIAMRQVLAEVEGERHRQHAKWGQQDWANGTGGEPERGLSREQTERLREIRRVHAESSRALCDAVASENRVTWRHILREELDEAVAEDDPAKLRRELVQVAAVAVAWIEAIDRAAKKQEAA